MKASTKKEPESEVLRFRLTKTLAARAKKRADREHRSVSYIIRIALQKYVTERPAK